MDEVVATGTDAEKRLLVALAWMCQQYLGSHDSIVLDHLCMAAGEDAVQILAEYGLVRADIRGGEWTEAGQALLNSA